MTARIIKEVAMKHFAARGYEGTSRWRQMKVTPKWKPKRHLCRFWICWMDIC